MSITHNCSINLIVINLRQMILCLKLKFKILGSNCQTIHKQSKIFNSHNNNCINKINNNNSF